MDTSKGKVPEIAPIGPTVVHHMTTERPETAMRRDLIGNKADDPASWPDPFVREPTGKEVTRFAADAADDNGVDSTGCS